MYNISHKAADLVLLNNFTMSNTELTTWDRKYTRTEFHLLIINGDRVLEDLLLACFFFLPFFFPLSQFASPIYITYFVIAGTESTSLSWCNLGPFPTKPSLLS